MIYKKNTRVSNFLALYRSIYITKMVRKKLDNRIRILIENGVALHHRSLFVVVGEKGRDCISILHEMLSKAEVKARPTVLWCYKKDLGFSSHKKKQKRLKKASLAQGKQHLDENDSIEYFVASTNIRYCYYSETHSIMGQTFGMAILQDFEAITPNLLARTIETVEGGGMILLLLQTITSIKQLYTMTMDVHARYRTEAHQNIVCRFNERFILSLTKCSNCLFLDDKLNILPIQSNALSIKPVAARAWDGPKTPEEEKLMNLKTSLDGSQPMHVLVKKCKTLDQAEAVMKFIDSLSEKTLRSTVTLTSARGRGKSAALGLAVAAAIAYKYPNIAVTSPHPENLKTFFKFLLEGLDALGYEKSTDYEEIRSTVPEYNKAIIQVNVTRKLRQRVRYIQPSDTKLDNVELLVIDEAAAIPLPFVKALMGPYLIFLASTINGYEGTGRSLSLKLISQLRKQQSANNDVPEKLKTRRSLARRILHELTLNESIRYKHGDKIEDWLNRLLCLNVTVPPSILNSSPAPDDCKLCYVNRDTLFSYHKDAERFLHNLVAILVASHYKNSPNDLQIMSDAPAHHIFCLCGPPKEQKSKSRHTELPEVLCVLQVCLEGKLSENTVKHELSHGRRGAGDLIPWTISQEFTQQDFPSLSGARLVRIATHPDYQGKGYGLLALKLLQDFYEGKFYHSAGSTINMTPLVYNDVEMEDDLEEKLSSQTSLPTLFPPLNELKPDILDYLGVSYGVSEELLRFWKKAKFCPVYLGYTANQLTGEHSCIMLKQLTGVSTSTNWLSSFTVDFCWKTIETILWLKLDADLALSLVSQECVPDEEYRGLSKLEVLNHLESEDLDNLKDFCNIPGFGVPLKENVVILSKFYFTHRLKDVQLTEIEVRTLFSYGILHRPLEVVAEHLQRTLQQTTAELLSGLQKIAAHIVEIGEA